MNDLFYSIQNIPLHKLIIGLLLITMALIYLGVMAFYVTVLFIRQKRSKKKKPALRVLPRKFDHNI